MHVAHCVTTDKPRCTACLCDACGHTSHLSHGLETQLLPVQLAASLRAAGPVSVLALSGFVTAALWLQSLFPGSMLWHVC